MSDALVSARKACLVAPNITSLRFKGRPANVESVKKAIKLCI